MVLADGKTFREKFGPRGVIHSRRYSEDRGHRSADQKAMETVDDETLDRAIEFIKAQEAEGHFPCLDGTLRPAAGAPDLQSAP